MTYIEQENLFSGSLSEEEYNNFGFDERQAQMTAEEYAAELLRESLINQGACL